MGENFERPRGANDNQKVDALEALNRSKATVALNKLDELLANDRPESLFYKKLLFEARSHIDKLPITADETDYNYFLLKRFNNIKKLGKERGLDV